MYEFLVYDGKNSAELVDGTFGHLQKCAQVVEKLCDDLPSHKNYKVFFDTWFITLDLHITLDRKEYMLLVQSH